MTKKKITQIAVSQEESTQAQGTFEQYHQIASELRGSNDREQAGAVLAPIDVLAEGVQIALVKELAKENHVDAADVLTAIHELGALKNVRKEAKRSLIRLENAKVYPKWEPPTEQMAITRVIPSTNPPRFWKGIVTDSLDIGQVQLLLCWEQGNDYKEIRVLGFLLEFGFDGVKDFFTTLESKRSFENMLARMQASMDDIKTKSCSLARGRRLLLDALAVHKKRGTMPHKDYRFNISLINQLILEAPDLGPVEEEDEEISLEPIDSDALGTVTGFINAWVDREYSQAYDLLAIDSILREELPKKKWVERRKHWAKEANPRNLKPNVIFERVEPTSSPLLPQQSSEPSSATHKEIKAGWSIQMNEIESANILPELPEATVVLEETGRHWFWTSYTIVQEDGEWRIQNMIDEGKRAQTLSIEELQQTIDVNDEQLQNLTQKYNVDELKQFSEEETLDYFRRINTYTMESTYYSDILIKKLPLERQNYANAAGNMLLFGQYERGLAYLILLTERFPEQRAANLRGIAAARRQLSEEYSEDENDEYAQQNEILAEEALRESLTLENSFEAHVTLAELLMDKEEPEALNEAKEHLLQAKELVTESEDKAHIELHLGEIALSQKQFEQALSHYQHALEILPEDAETWFGIGEAYEGLAKLTEAEASYKQAIALDPEHTLYYWTLSRLYINNKQYPKAIELLKRGLRANPDSVELYAYMAAAYIESGNIRQAEITLQKAEELDPESEIVQALQQMILATKTEQPRATGRLGRALQQKKTKR